MEKQHTRNQIAALNFHVQNIKGNIAAQASTKNKSLSRFLPWHSQQLSRFSRIVSELFLSWKFSVPGSFKRHARLIAKLSRYYFQLE